MSMVKRIGIGTEPSKLKSSLYLFNIVFFIQSSYSSEIKFSFNGVSRPDKNSLQDLREGARGLYQRAEKLEQKINTSSFHDIR